MCLHENFVEHHYTSQYCMKWSVAASSVGKTGSSSAVSGRVPAAVVRSRIPPLLPRPLCITQAGRLQPHSGGYSAEHVSINQVYKDALTLKNTCKSMFWLIVEVFMMLKPHAHIFL